MIGRLRGRLAEVDADGTLVVDVGGVGYEVVAPLGTVGRLVAGQDGAVELLVHTHVREDAIVLYGFANASERHAFRALNTVAKIGPKLALAVLGHLGVDELSSLLAAGDVVRLSKVPGIGKKTAERLVLELENKLAAPARSPGMTARLPTGQAAQLQETLVRMGFRPAEAERAIAALPALDRPLDELLRAALSTLAP